LIAACDGSRTAKKWLWTAKSISAELKNQLHSAKVTGNRGVPCIGKFAPDKKPVDFALNTSIIRSESEISSSMDFVPL